MPTPPPTDVRHADRAVAEYGDLGRAWVAAKAQGDPPADAFATDLRRLGHRRGMALLRQAIESGIGSVEGAPDSLRELFADLDAEPDWVDHGRLDRAGEVLVRQSLQFGLVLGSVSLVSGYANPAAALPLVLTGRYADQAGVRSLEVGAWLREILAPGGLRRDGLGFERTVRVRVIHALVRQHLDAQPQWDHHRLGRPINQADMAFTLTEFGVLTLEAMGRLGVDLTAQEVDDLALLWRYVGHLSGVGPVLLPHTMADQSRLGDLYHLTRPGADETSRRLVHGLLEDFLVPEVALLLPAPLRGQARAVTAGVIRGLVGDDLADELEVPPSSYGRALPVVAAATRISTRAQDALPGGRARRTRRGYRYRDTQERRLRERLGVSHDLVDSAPDAPGSHPAGPPAGPRS